MSVKVKVIKKNKFDVSGIIKSTFNPGDDITVSYSNYLRVCSYMSDAISIMRTELKDVNPNNTKGTFKWFRSDAQFFKPTKATTKDERTKFNNFYASFKRGENFKEFFAFANALQVYNKFTLEEKKSLGTYRIIYNSASGSARCSKYYVPIIGNELSEQFCSTIINLSIRIKKIIITIDKSDRSSLTIEKIFGQILNLVKKNNPRITISPNIKNIFNATYDTFQEKLDEIYAGYILTGSELGMFVCLIRAIITALQDREDCKDFGVDDSKDEAMFKDLISILSGLKDSISRELSTNERLALSDEKLEELRDTLSVIGSISDDPTNAVKSIMSEL